jgi:acyl-coenzyme A thioesterase 13
MNPSSTPGKPLDIKTLTAKGFERAFAGLELLSLDGGRARARLTVDESVENFTGNLHGGASATLVDFLGTAAIISADRDGRPGVSTDLNVSFYSAGRHGDVVIVEAQVLKVGRTLGFVEVTLKRERDGALIASGRMTKFLG